MLLGIVVVAVVLASPQAAYGQTAETRYGPGPCAENVIPKGKYQYPVGVDKKTIALKVDPAFAEKMKKERNLENLPVTPIYDLVVEAVPIFGFCYTERPEDYSTTPPETLPFLASIELKGEKIVSVLPNSRKESDDGRIVYEWKVKGWKYGIASGERLEKLIETVQRNDPSLKIVIEAQKANGEVDRAQKGITFSLCAPVWGDGQHKVVYERGMSAFSPYNARVSMQAYQIIEKAEDARVFGFEKVDPYAEYKEKFSHLVDLARHDDSLYLYGIASTRTPTKYMRGINSNSSCRLSKGDYSYTTYNYLLYANVEAAVDGTAIDGIATLGGRNSVVSPDTSTETVMHEFGHLFAGLFDEDGGKGATIRRPPGKNCVFDPVSDFAHGGKQYGEGSAKSVVGCNHARGLPFKNFYRPSPTALMNYPKKDMPRDGRLSAVDCGFAIAAITQRGTGPEYFPECMGLDVIKPTGAAAALSPARLLASLSDVLPAVPPSGDAEVGNADMVVFEKDTYPAAGVVWYDGEPMPPSLKFPEPDTAAVIKKLRTRLKELTKQRDELRARRNILRGVWSVPTTPVSPSPLLNAVPLRQQLGNISASLQSILEAMQGVIR